MCVDDDIIYGWNELRRIIWPNLLRAATYKYTNVNEYLCAVYDGAGDVSILDGKINY